MDIRRFAVDIKIICVETTASARMARRHRIVRRWLRDEGQNSARTSVSAQEYNYSEAFRARNVGADIVRAENLQPLPPLHQRVGFILLWLNIWFYLQAGALEHDKRKGVDDVGCRCLD